MKGDPVRLTVRALVGDAAKDRLMHATDLFEPFKALVDQGAKTRDSIVTGVEEEGGVKHASIIECFRKGAEAAGLRVVACWIEGHRESAWADPVVRAVSDGYKWGTFQSWLLSHGFPGQHPSLKRM